MRHYYATTDGRYVTDLSPQASQLWACIGPRPMLLSDAAIEHGLPDGWEWLSDEEWEAMQASLSKLEPEAAYTA